MQREIEPVLTPHSAVFTGQTGCGKTQKVLDLLLNEYKFHFEYIVILCPTLEDNKTYHKCQVLWTDDDVFLIDPKDQLLDLINKFSIMFRGFETLFILDDCIADEELDKKRTKLLNLAISGRHREHSLWLLTQSYTAIPKNLRRQKKMLFLWHPDDKADLKTIDNETNIIDDDEEWKTIKKKLKDSKFGHLYLRSEHPRGYNVMNC